MNAKQKGNRFEREMAAILRERIWPACYTSRFMGSAWDDYNGIDLTGTPGYHQILKSMLQNEKINIVIHKKNDQGCIVAMELSDFIKLAKK